MVRAGITKTGFLTFWTYLYKLAAIGKKFRAKKNRKKKKKKESRMTNAIFVIFVI